MTFSEAAKKLMEAELGNLYMNETGKIIFRSRLKTSPDPTEQFTEDNIIDYKLSDDSNIYNVVEISANVRVVQTEQTVYTLSSALPVIASGNTEIFFNFDDPVTDVTSITLVANTEEDGSGVNIGSDISVDSTELFNTSIKVVFDNANTSSGYITALTILGTPAKIARTVYLRMVDQDSVDQYEEQILKIENDFIQSDSAAESVAVSALEYYKDYGNTIEMTVKGDFARQLGDIVHVNVDEIEDNFVINKIVNILRDGSYTQRITAKISNIPPTFYLDQSILDGPDTLGL